MILNALTSKTSKNWFPKFAVKFANFSLEFLPTKTKNFQSNIHNISLNIVNINVKKKIYIYIKIKNIIQFPITPH